MPLWSFAVELVRASVFAVAHVCGNSVGSGILAVSLLVRLALLPLTIRMARRVAAHQARIALLRPQLERLQRLHGADRARLAEATMQLYREHDVGLMPRGTLAPMLIQLPIGAAVYQAFARTFGPRQGFLWVADLARPDALLAVAAAALAAWGAALGTDGQGGRTAVAVSATITLVLAWRLSASVALYWIASSGVSAVQTLVLRRNGVGAPA